MNKYLNKYLTLSDWVKFLPFLFIYFVLIAIFCPNGLYGDENGYVMFAQNILNGFYSPPYPDINLWFGPGYPLLIAPFIFFNVPYTIIRLLNAIMVYCALVITYKSITVYSCKKVAFLFTVLIGSYFPCIQSLKVMSTEIICWLLISLICYFTIKIVNHKGKIPWKQAIILACAVAAIAMTKVIFGYVIMIMLFVALFAMLFKRLRANAKLMSLVFAIAFMFCMPYLIYTYSLTKQPLYWGNSGGMSLYAMSSPYENEFGDWFSESELKANPNHQVFMASIEDLSPIEKDAAYKAAAIENIKNNPGKFLKNWGMNISRFLFEYPYSYELQSPDTLFYLFPTMFVFVFIILSLLAAIAYIGRIPQEIIILLLFFLIYLGGNSLLSAQNRMFAITLPFWALFISYVFSNIVSIKIKPEILTSDNAVIKK